MTTTNIINFDKKDIKNSTGSGLISTLTNDIRILVEPFKSQNAQAPTHQVFGFSPSGHKINVGGIWEKQSQEGKPYFTLSIKAIGFNANLGQCAGQDDPCVQAIIPWNS